MASAPPADKVAWPKSSFAPTVYRHTSSSCGLDDVSPDWIFSRAPLASTITTAAEIRITRHEIYSSPVKEGEGGGGAYGRISLTNFFPAQGYRDGQPHRKPHP